MCVEDWAKARCKALETTGAFPSAGACYKTRSGKMQLKRTNLLIREADNTVQTVTIARLANGL